MTLLEALIAIVVLTGVAATAIETFRAAGEQSMRAEMMVEAAGMAESLLSRAGEDLTTSAERSLTDERGSMFWRLDMIPQGDQKGKTRLLEVDAYVKLTRGTAVVEQHLSTLTIRTEAVK